MAAVNYVTVNELSFASAGNCAAGGSYTDRHHHIQGFVVAMRNGRWSKATGLPGLGALNKGGSATVASVSCPSPGRCTAAGAYRSGGRERGFVTQTS